jgi:hypothetical protein
MAVDSDRGLDSNADMSATRLFAPSLAAAPAWERPSRGPRVLSDRYLTPAWDLLQPQLGMPSAL